MSQYLIASMSYTFLANILMWPSGTVPVTTVRDDEQTYDIEDLPADQRDQISKLADTVMKGSAGLPMGVSVLTPALTDERCLHVMKIIESSVGFDTKPKGFLSSGNKE